MDSSMASTFASAANESRHRSSRFECTHAMARFARSAARTRAGAPAKAPRIAAANRVGASGSTNFSTLRIASAPPSPRGPTSAARLFAATATAPWSVDLVASAARYKVAASDARPRSAATRAACASTGNNSSAISSGPADSSSASVSSPSFLARTRYSAASARSPVSIAAHATLNASSCDSFGETPADRSASATSADRPAATSDATRLVAAAERADASGANAPRVSNRSAYASALSAARPARWRSCALSCVREGFEETRSRRARASGASWDLYSAYARSNARSSGAP